MVIANNHGEKSERKLRKRKEKKRELRVSFFFESATKARVCRILEG